MPPISKLYTVPKIAPANLSMSTDWYVWFRYYNANTKTWEQFRFKKGINKFRTLKERLPVANALKEVLSEELAAGWNPLQNIIQQIRISSLGQAIKHILGVKEKTLSKKSQHAYKYITDSLLDWLKNQNNPDIKLSDFTGSMAQKYMDFLLMTKEYSGRTFNDHLIILRTFFNCFIDREWISKNPFRTVKKKQQTIGRNHAFNDQEKKMLENYFKKHQPRLYYLTQIMYYCYIRRTEMLSLQVKHVDMINKTITIPGANAKNRSQESVVIPVGLEPVIEAMKLHSFHPEDYLFGRRLQTCSRRNHGPNYLSEKHNTIVKKLGIDPQKGLYSWKHTGVCKAYYLTGKDVYAIMRQLRHRDFNTTQIYLKSLGLIQNDVFRNAMVA